MAGRGMFRDAQKGITAKQFDELGNEVSFDVREDEEMVRIAHEQVIYTTCTALSSLLILPFFLSMVQSFGYFLKSVLGALYAQLRTLFVQSRARLPPCTLPPQPCRRRGI